MNPEEDSSFSADYRGIAIIGMSGRFPGAACVADFWKNLRDGVESVSGLSEADLDEAGVASQRRLDSRFVRSASLLEGIELFDAAFFDMSAREAQITDPQHRLFLECAWHAIEDAGCDPARYPGEIGIFAGAGRNSYFLRNVSADETLRDTLDDYQIIIGSEGDYLATRVAFKLNLHGPAVTVQTACSTSLVAVHMACRSLLDGECQVALAGGVSVRVPQKAGYLYKESGIGTPGTLVSFPISPQRFLVIADEWEWEFMHYKLDDPQVFVRRVVNGADRFVFAKQESYLIVKAIAARSHTVSSRSSSGSPANG